jgi:energy-converting hydrogenase Eha subunit A
MNFLTPTERIVLCLVVLISATLFWLRFRRVLGRIRHSKRDSDFRVQPVGGRLWRFFFDVLLQSKVIRQRPLPGLAHALVFWGFCVFALVTVNHVATGLGFPIFRRERGFGFFYWWFAFAFAAMVAAGIAGLFIRRFVVRPKWLEPLSYESGVIAGLIFLLMATYMPMWWLPEATLQGHILWWMHTLVLLAFLPLIPHMIAHS